MRSGWGEARVRPIDETSSAFYLHLDVVDRPGVLAEVAGVFGVHDVSIRSVNRDKIGQHASRAVDLAVPGN